MDKPGLLEQVPLAYLVPFRQLLLPFGADVRVVGGYVEKPGDTRLYGFGLQPHASFLRRSARLLSVAGRAGADDVLPGVRPVAVARYHVVERQVPCLLAAILAGVVITFENLQPCQPSYRTRRAFNHIRQADDCRYWEFSAD